MNNSQGPGTNTYSILMGFVAMSAIMCSTMYLPLFPEIMAELGVGRLEVKLSLTALFLGGVFGKSMTAFISANINERSLLVGFMSLFLVGSIICGLAENINLMYFGRFLQGFGSSAGPVIVRAIAAEDFEGRRFYRVMITLILMYSISPGLAPFIGGYLGEILGWRTIFYVLSGMSLMSVFIAMSYRYKVPPPPGNESQTIPLMLEALKNQNFQKQMALAMMSYAQVYIFLPLSTFMFRHDFGWHPSEYAWVGIAVAFGSAVGALLTRALVAYRGPLSLLPYAFTLQAVVCMLLFILALGKMGTGQVVLIAIIFYFMGTAMVAGISIGEAIEAVKIPKALLSSLVGLLLIFYIALVSVLTSFLRDDLLTISFIFFVPLLASCLVYRYMIKT